MTSLRTKITLLLLAATLFTGLGILFALQALGRLEELAARESATAVSLQVETRLRTLAEEAARRDDQVFERAKGDALTLARFAAYLYGHPELFPAPLQGGTPLLRTAQGHLVNERATPIGVFMPVQAEMTPTVWREVGLLSHIDPLLISLQGNTPHVARVWITTRSRFTRVYPNIGLGYPGSPIGPDYDLTGDVFFTMAVPGNNPARQPVWTPPYADPAGQGLMVTAAVPVYGDDGVFHAVAGVDLMLDKVIGDVLNLDAGAGGYAFLIDREGRVIAAPPAGLTDLGIPFRTPAPGQVAEVSLKDSAYGDAAGLQAASVRAGAGSSSAEIVSAWTASGRRFFTLAGLPATGWVLGVSLPESEVIEAADTTAAAIAGARRQLYARALLAAIGLALIVVLGAFWAARALTRPVRQLAEGARRLGSGDLAYRINLSGNVELAAFAREFDQMAARLQALHDNLEGQVAERTAALLREERRRAEQARELAVLDERNRLAREIHDTLAQGFTGIIMQLQAAEDAFADGPAAAGVHIGRAAQLARDSLQEARRSVWNLRPGALAEGTIVSALREEVSRRTGGSLKLEFKLEGEVRPLADKIEETLLRVCQEALNNAGEHAGASRVTVTLRFGPDGVSLAVTDDGRGLPGVGGSGGPVPAVGAPEPVTDSADPATDPADPAADQFRRGLGLITMRERVEGVGGIFRIGAAGACGTRIEAFIPAEARAVRVGAESAGLEVQDAS